MQPNEQPQFSIDYLDQISSGPKKPGIKDRLFPIILIGGLLIAGLIGLLLLLGGGAEKHGDLTRLALRLKTLQSVTDSSQRMLKSSTLRGTNSNLSLFLTNTNRDVASLLAKNNISMKKIDPKLSASENGSQLKDKLEEARLNAVYDRTYAREMTYQLGALAALMQQIEANTNSKSDKTFLRTARAQLEPIQKQFSEFTAASN